MLREATVSNEEHRLTFNTFSQRREAPFKKTEPARQDQDGGCCNEAASERGVWTNHGVLHRVRNDQDQHQVHATQLRRFSAANQAEAKEQEEVDHNSSEDDVERKIHERSILPR